MSKRKVAFVEPDGAKSDEPPWKLSKDTEGASSEGTAGERLRTFKQNHTLDSDEEEEEDVGEKYGLKEDDVVEGTEDTTIAVDGEMKVTPFNLREEMSEGRFDADGNYFEKKNDDIRDNWLDNIDWVQVKKPSTEEADEKESQETGLDEKPEPEVFTEMLELMKPGETITKALQRLGGGRTTKRRKSQTKGKRKEEEEESKGDGDKDSLLRLSGLADEIVCRGNYEVYGYTYERIQHKLKNQEEQPQEKKDAEFDMFGEEVDESKLSKPPADTEAAGDKLDLSDKINWEFKWEDVEDAKTYGPYPSEQMQKWVEQDYFKDGVYVRKVGRDQSFHSSKRIDFEIYT